MPHLQGRGKDRARLALAAATTVHMQISNCNVLEFGGYVTADANQWTETPEMSDALGTSMVLQPSEQQAELPPQGIVNGAAKPTATTSDKGCLSH